MQNNIVITGMGAVTPIGVGVPAYFDALLRGDCGIVEITQFSTQELPIKVAAQVKAFEPRRYLNARLAADLDDFMQYAYVAAEEALTQSGDVVDAKRTGIVMGTALAGLAYTEANAGCGKSVSPRFISKIMGNIAAANFAISHKLQGPSLTVSTACSSGGDAITTACMLLAVGAADRMVVMAGDAAACPLFLGSLGNAGAMSRSGRCRPFDRARDGFVVGEGGGALILETEHSAKARGAHIYARLLGCANTNDAYHPVSPAPNGEGAAECMRLALAQAGLEPSEIGYLNAHGTATIKGDLAEGAAIERVFGSHRVPISSTKGATGHMMGAGGVTETIACIKALETGLLPPTVGFSSLDEALSLNVISGQPQQRELRAAMSTALGFGGQNSCIIVGKA